MSVVIERIAAGEDFSVTSLSFQEVSVDLEADVGEGDFRAQKLSPQLLMSNCCAVRRQRCRYCRPLDRDCSVARSVIVGHCQSLSEWKAAEEGP